MRLLVPVCALVGFLATPARAADVPGDARQTIAAANDAWLPAMKQQDAAAIVEPYADKGVFVTATGQIATGRDGIGRLMRERFAAGRVVDGMLQQDGIRMEGSLIYEWGHADIEIDRPGGGRAKSSGRYLTVWKRSGTGKWEIIRNLSLAD
jgi:uncharacterized protein (TIGR02246 family)